MRFRFTYKRNPPWKFLRQVALFAFLLIGLSSHAQQVSLSVKEAKLETVFEEIKKQTGFSFVYSSTETKNAKPVTVSFKNVSLQTALTAIFVDQPLRYSIEDDYIVVQAKPPALQKQSFEIRGRIVNEGGEALAGVSVNVIGSMQGAATNENGEFSISLESNVARLEITSVGFMPKEIEATASRLNLVILLPSINKLDEQLVIAYGKTTKRQSTGTISKVSKSDIQKQPISNPLAALSGRVAGLQVTQGSGLPGTFFTLRLRGQNSIANGNDPLIIIDGIPFPSTTLNGSFGGGGGAANSPLSNINPSDIESIEVLKDADATAIYGSRGANGVIMITTKKALTNKTLVELSSYTGWGRVPKRLNLLNTKDYLTMRREAFANDGVVPTASNARDLILWDTTRYTDWQKELLGGTMKISDVKLSVSDGNQNTQFLLGTGYHKESTVMPMDFGEEKVSVNFSVRHKSANQKLVMTLGGNYLRNQNVLPQNDLSSSISLPPNAPKLYDSLGRLNWENSTWQNPISQLLKEFRTTTDNILFTNSFSYSLLPSLEVKANVSLNRISQKEHIVIPIASNDPAFNSSGTAGFGNNVINTVIAEPQVNYRVRVFKGSLSLLAGLTLQATRQEALYQIASGYANDELLSSVRAASTISTSNEINSFYRYSGLFSRINYDYLGRYIVNLTLRRDGSSRYGPDNRFANFGSAGIAWIFSKEKFFSRLPALSYGKIKASVGVTGNDQIGDYRYLDTYSPYQYTYMGIVPYQPSQLYNPGFGWERVVKKEIGLELGFVKDRVLLTANYYRNTTTNQLVSYALPTMTGFNGVLQNLPATILNSGVELELSSTFIQQKRFQWTSQFNLTIPKNKLLDFEGLSRSTYANTYIVGQSLFIARRYSYTGIHPQTGDYTFQDVNGDGKLTIPQDLNAVVFTGQQSFGGWQNNFSYNRASLSFLFQFVRQKFSIDYSSRLGKPGGFGNQPLFVLNRWQRPGDDAEFQKFSNSNAANNTAYSNFLSSDASFSDASFIRLRSVELSWRLTTPSSGLKYVSNCSIYVQGLNLLTFTRYRGLDPETKSVFPPTSILTIGFRYNN